MHRIYMVTMFLLVKGEEPKNLFATFETKKEADDFYFEKVHELRAKYDVGKVVQNMCSPLSRRFTVKHSTVTFNVALQYVSLTNIGQ